MVLDVRIVSDHHIIKTSGQSPAWPRDMTRPTPQVGFCIHSNGLERSRGAMVEDWCMQ